MKLSRRCSSTSVFHSLIQSPSINHSFMQQMGIKHLQGAQRYPRDLWCSGELSPASALMSYREDGQLKDKQIDFSQP